MASARSRAGRVLVSRSTVMGCATHWPCEGRLPCAASQRGYAHRALCPGVTEYYAFDLMYTDRCAFSTRGSNDGHGPAGWSQPALSARSDTDRRDNPVSPATESAPTGVERLTGHANVSKRTFYPHFSG